MNQRRGRKIRLLKKKTTPVEAFTFGKPSAVLDKREILDYIEYNVMVSGMKRRIARENSGINQ